MSTFGKSFTRELGKNTGKWVSNKIFGSGHSTPHRVIHSREREKQRRELNEAQNYKAQQKQIEAKRKEADRLLREKDRQLAENERQGIISSNKKEVAEHNNYLKVIQTVHKDYAEKMDWESIIKEDNPHYIETGKELEDYYQNYTNEQIEQKFKELKVENRFTVAKHILGGLYKPKYRLIFFIASRKQFIPIALALSLISMTYIFPQPFEFKVVYLSLLFLIIILLLLLRTGATDFERFIHFNSELLSLEKKRKEWFEKYIIEQDNAHEQYLEEINQLKVLKSIANDVKTGKLDAYIYAINLVKPFQDLKLYGSDISYEIIEETLLITFYVHGREAIPDYYKKLDSKGLQIIEEKISNSKYQELYQDYVCSCILRIGKEVFQLLPIDMFYINTKANILNKSTGNFDESTILSIKVERGNLEKLNFDLLDPSESMRNFYHNMDFKKTEGFKSVKELT